MEYQIKYLMGLRAVNYRGTLDIEDETLRLKRVPNRVARRRLRIWLGWCFCGGAFLSPLLQALWSETWGIQWGYWLLFYAAFSAVGYYPILYWGLRTTSVEFQTTDVTDVERWRKKVSFKVPNRLESEEPVKIVVKAKTIEEAEQIEEALREASGTSSPRA